MSVNGQGALVLKLFETYHDRVYWFARRWVDAPTAEDVSQEVFMRLLRIPDLADRIVNVSYLLKVADNLIKRRHKQKQQLERFAAVTAREDVEVFETGESDAPRAARCEMDRLSGTEQEALRMIVCEGLTYEAAARALDVKVSTVNNWKFRGIQKLRGEGEIAASSVAV